MITQLLLASLLSSTADHPPGMYWSLSTRVAYANAHDEEIDDMGSGLLPELRFELGEMVTPHLGLNVLLAIDTMSTDDWSFGGFAAGLGAAIYPFAGRLALRPSLGFIVMSTSRSDDAARLDDDPGSLYGTRGTLGVTYDVLRIGERNALAVGAEGFAMYGSGTRILGAGITISFSRFAAP